MNQKFFCPAPWTSVYYHKDSTISPCHTNRGNTETLTLQEYVNSDWLNNLKREFEEDKVPESCKMCFERETRNLKSTRKQFLYMVEQFGFSPTFKRIELRASNLCNFKCRMCDADSSSEIEKENAKYPEIRKLTKQISVEFNHETEIIDELRWFLDTYPTLESVCFTGGEPMLIKTYYQFMDYMIEKNRTDNITIDLFTNCSVYNPLFMDRLLQFKRVNFTMSIDGVGRTAEYQRHGTKWDVVEKNVLQFVMIPRRIYFNTAISPYVLLDVSSLAKFLMQLYELNNDILTRCYAVISPRTLHFENMNNDLREMAYKEIDKAVEILTPTNFDVFKKEILGIKHQLQTTQPKDPDLFVRYTRTLDTIRNEKFEDVFGYKLY